MPRCRQLYVEHSSTHLQALFPQNDVLSQLFLQLEEHKLQRKKSNHTEFHYLRRVIIRKISRVTGHRSREGKMSDSSFHSSFI